VTAIPNVVNRLARFELVTPDADRLAQFYQRAFGFRRLTDELHSGSDFEQLRGVKGGARSTTVAFGRQTVDLLQFDQLGRPYPSPASSTDLIFQHIAIVVADMSKAYQRLSTVGGWVAISTDGPQRLPRSSGGVTAFKFRDPDGHPLE
jgi:catechol 2,3-dioxygenase-like lactoylglutathione lyase family enzyme